MSDTKPGADELRIRALLVARQVGPDAVPPKPTTRPRDWLDDLIDTDLAPEPEPEEEPAAPAPAETPAPAKKQTPAPKPGSNKARKKRQKKDKPGAPRSPLDSRPSSPRQSLADAWDNVPPRLKWLGYHATAAYLGWSCGLVGWSTYVTGWIADTGPAGPQAFFWYAAAGATFLLYRRTRAWWWPVAWLAAVPVSSTVVGVLLYGTPNP